MNLYSKIYATPFRRTLMRFFESFVIAGTIATLELGLQEGLFSGLAVGIAMALLKFLRELKK